MPANTVKVDRSTRWGNPFVVGKDGTAAECVYWYMLLMQGCLVLTSKSAVQLQEEALRQLVIERERAWAALRGKNLACWCRTDKPCHAEVLLCAANGGTFDAPVYFDRYGFEMPGQTRQED